MLNQVVEIYVPSTVDGNHPAPDLHDMWTKKVLEQMAGLFGGATAIPAKGSWIGEKGLVLEDVKIVRSYCSRDDLAKYLAHVKNCAANLCSAMSQECVSLVINGELQFIEAPSKTKAA